MAVSIRNPTESFPPICLPLKTNIPSLLKEKTEQMKSAPVDNRRKKPHPPRSGGKKISPKAVQMKSAPVDNRRKNLTPREAGEKKIPPKTEQTKSAPIANRRKKTSPPAKRGEENPPKNRANEIRTC
jgi:hypothetical protein